MAKLFKTYFPAGEFISQELEYASDARRQFFSNRIVDLWNSLPAAVVLNRNVAVYIRQVDVQQLFTLLLIICLYMCLL